VTRRRVYVRGVGAWTPLGETWPASLARLAAGEGAIAPVTRFDASGFPCTVAASIPAARAAGGDPRLVLAARAAREAWRSAAIADGEVAAERIGVFVGAEGGRPDLEAAIRAALRREGEPLPRELAASASSPALVAATLAGAIGSAGPVETISLACASGAAAIIEAVRALRAGACDLALAGGVGADADPFLLAGFGLLGALSPSGVSRPFDARRDGFVLGECAAFAVLSCARGGAAVEVAGVAMTADGYHLTAPEPSGAQAARALRAALDDAGATGVDYVQAHGTSTPLNDAVEAAAIARVLGSGLGRARVSSVKGALGHAIAGAGAAGFLCAVEAVASGTLLPTVGLAQPDPACDLPHVLGRALAADAKVAVASALAFGGANASIVVARA
jgi:3-oxoacyl-[acyl-carrier-protein] synthase II